MRRKVNGINFIPRAINFSELQVTNDEGESEDIEFGANDPEPSMVENMICQMMYSLGSDKERCVLLLQILREHGFNFDHKSSANALHINWRWYMRVKGKVRDKLSKFNMAQ